MISVIIPVYNAERFLRQTVRSVLDLDDVSELILFDDGSTDASLHLCRELAMNDDRIIVHQHPGGVNKGVSATRNAAIRLASKDFVAFLDSDDVFLPNRFALEPSVFSEHPDADGVYGAIGILVHDESSRSDYDSRFKSELTTIRKRVKPEELFEGLSGGILDLGHFSLDGLTIRRSALDAMPQLLQEDMSMHEDSEFLTRLSFHSRLYPGSLERPVALRGVHGENRVTRNDRVAYTRQKQFEHLLDWSLKFNIPKAARDRFRTELTHYQVRAACLERDRLKALGLMFRDPAQFKRPDSVHALIDAFIPKGSRMSLTAHQFSDRVFRSLWKIKGAEQPATTAENEELLRRR